MQAAEQSILSFFNPQLTLDGGSLTAGVWPMVSLTEVSAVASAYLLLVFVGRLVMADKPEVSGPWIKRMMIAYNAVQVVLCLYMAVEAVRQFILLDYRPLCNTPATQKAGESYTPTGMSNVLWVFYMSKVRAHFSLSGEESIRVVDFTTPWFGVCRSLTFAIPHLSYCARSTVSSGAHPLPWW